MAKKLIGRVGVAVLSSSPDYISYRITLAADNGLYSDLRIGFSALATTAEPNCAFAFQVESGLRLEDFNFQKYLKLLSKLQTAMQKIKSLDVGLELQFVNYR